MAAQVEVTFKGRTLELDLSGASHSADALSAVVDAFKLREHARVVLRRADDGVVVVASAKMAPGQYNLELVDDGAGNMKRNALLAFLGAPVLLFYYSLVLPRVFQD